MPIIRQIQQLEELQQDWNAVAGAGGHALLRHEWILCAARTLYDPAQLVVVIRKSGGRLTAAAPLAHRKVAGVTRLEFLGSSTLHEPCGLLSVDEAARDELLEEVLGMATPLILQRIDGDPNPLIVRAKKRGAVHAKPGAPSLCVRLSDASRDPLERLPGKLRYDVRRARARAASMGAVNVEAVSPAPDESDRLLARFMDVEVAGWKGQRGSALKSNPRLNAFFRCYCRLASNAGILRMFFLRIGESVAAAQIAVEAYGRLWVLKIGYDERLARCSPGFLLTAETIFLAAKQGLSGYEFLGTPEPWEARWGPEAHATSLVVWYPRNVRGSAAAVLDVAGAAWRRLRPGGRRD